jgi:hypothetical protein
LDGVEEGAPDRLGAAGQSPWLDGVHGSGKRGREDFVAGAAGGLESPTAPERGGAARHGVLEGWEGQGFRGVWHV